MRRLRAGTNVPPQPRAAPGLRPRALQTRCQELAHGALPRLAAAEKRGPACEKIAALERRAARTLKRVLTPQGVYRLPKRCVALRSPLVFEGEGKTGHPGPRQTTGPAERWLFDN